MMYFFSILLLLTLPQGLIGSSRHCLSLLKDEAICYGKNFKIGEKLFHISDEKMNRGDAGNYCELAEDSAYEEMANLVKDKKAADFWLKPTRSGTDSFKFSDDEEVNDVHNENKPARPNLCLKIKKKRGNTDRHQLFASSDEYMGAFALCEVQIEACPVEKNCKTCKDVVCLTCKDGKVPVEGTCDASTRFAIVIDAGSSGTRARVLQIHVEESLSQVPVIKEMENKKEKPGIADFVEDLDGLKNQLIILLDFCKSVIPEANHKNTSIYVFATAGMRLLTYDKADDVMDFIRDCLQDKSFSPFKHYPTNTRILSGEEEGAFSWISTNYLNGFFDGNSDYDLLKSLGIVELGGASAQIAFLTDGPILASKFPLKIAGVRYPLYSRSHLVYGRDQSNKWVYQYLIRNKNPLKLNTIPNPCMVQGDEDEHIINGNSYIFIGNPSPLKCYEILQELVYLSPDYRCYPSPCSIGSAYQPPIDDKMKFNAISGFANIAEDLGFMDKGGIATGEEMFFAAYDLCKKYKVLDLTDVPYIAKRCHDGLYTTVLQTKGFGFSPTYPMQYTFKIKENDINWAIGAVLYEMSKES